MGVRVLGDGQFGAVGDPDHHGAPGQGAVVDSDDVGVEVRAVLVGCVHNRPSFC
ncbi:hypothetical protein ACQ86D_03975 [Streptomyces galilaeus]